MNIFLKELIVKIGYLEWTNHSRAYINSQPHSYIQNIVESVWENPSLGTDEYLCWCDYLR